jgi:hypothetical protein
MVQVWGKSKGFRELFPKYRSSEVRDRTEKKMVGRGGIEPPTPGFSVLGVIRAQREDFTLLTSVLTPRLRYVRWRPFACCGARSVTVPVTTDWVRERRVGDGSVGIIRSPVRAMVLRDLCQARGDVGHTRSPRAGVSIWGHWRTLDARYPEGWHVQSPCIARGTPRTPCSIRSSASTSRLPARRPARGAGLPQFVDIAL